jgi:hypothetical protein
MVNQAPSTSPNAADGTELPAPIAFSEFLESVPPGQTRQIADVATIRSLQSGGFQVRLNTPEIHLHCSSAQCNGFRFFRSESGPPGLEDSKTNQMYVRYVCSNRTLSVKTFALAVSHKGSREARSH